MEQNQKENPIETYLGLGISALANTHRQYPGQWFRGHAGASVLAGALMLAEKLVADNSREAVKIQISGLIDSGPLFDRKPEEDGYSLQPLLDELQHVTENLSADGHGVIYGALALKALHREPGLITRSNVQGIANLIRDSEQDAVNRYYGLEDYKALRVDPAYPAFTSTEAAFRQMMLVHEKVFPDQTLDGRLYFFAGDQLHLITHAHALYTLDQLGYKKLAEAGLGALRKHGYLMDKRIIPPGLKPYTASAVHDPRENVFWQRNKRDPHQLKLAYSVLMGLKLLSENQHSKVLQDLSPYWELLG